MHLLYKAKICCVYILEFLIERLKCSYVKNDNELYFVSIVMFLSYMTIRIIFISLVIAEDIYAEAAWIIKDGYFHLIEYGCYWENLFFLCYIGKLINLE
jgi:hypothetical protein